LGADLEIAKYFIQLHEKCGQILVASTQGANSAMIAESLHFATELECWHKILEHRAEAKLLKVAILEYQFSLLALAQGHYRHSFKSLRLVLELTLQAVQLLDERCPR
jgi:hypothetical protein